MKSEEKILSAYSGYSNEELHESLTEPIIQPYDCFMAMIEFAEQEKKFIWSEAIRSVQQAYEQKKKILFVLQTF